MSLQELKQHYEADKDIAEEVIKRLDGFKEEFDNKRIFAMDKKISKIYEECYDVINELIHELRKDYDL